jgi:plastocyanin
MPRSMWSSRVPLTLLAATILALAGCGKDAVVDRNGVLNLTLDEYRIVPEKIRVGPGPLRIIARNRGVLTHNVVVQEFDPRGGKTAEVYGRTDTAHPGQTVTAKLSLAPGKYRLVCTIGNHEDLGQYSTVEVTSR